MCDVKVSGTDIQCFDIQKNGILKAFERCMRYIRRRITGYSLIMCFLIMN